jgi:hypothetical protein
MSKWFSPLALTALLLVVAWFVALMCVATFTDWGETEAPAPTPRAVDSPWVIEQKERYGDEAWQQFSH